MPAAAAVVVGAAFSATTITAGALAFSLSTFLANTAIGLVLSFASSALAPKPKEGGIGNDNLNSGGLTQTLRQPVATHKIVMGETRAGGTLVFAGMTENNKYLHLVVVYSARESKAINETWVNDYCIPPDALDGSGNVTTGRYANLIKIKKHLGAPGQTVDTDLNAAIPAWNNNCRLSGHTYCYYRLQYDQDKWPGGIPNLSQYLLGAIMDDPRDAAKFTTNGALFVNDLIANEDYGVNDGSSVDETTLIATANICDEYVTVTDVPLAVTSTAPTTDIMTLDSTLLDFQRADKIRFSSNGKVPRPLLPATDYYVIPYQFKDSARIKVASSMDNAIAGTAIDLTTDGSEGRTNLCLQSQTFDNASWTKTNCTVTANATNAPDGTATADKIVEANDVAQNHQWTQSVAYTTGLYYTISVYAKADTRGYLRIFLPSSPFTLGQPSASFNLITGALGTVSNGTATIEAAANGFYRCTLTGLCDTTASGSAIMRMGNAINSPAYNGDGVSGLYVWGAQIEQYEQATSYIATTTTAVTVTGATTVTKVAEPRYHASGILDTGNVIEDNLKDLLSAIGGRTIWTGGRWHIKAGVYEAPTVEFTLDDIVDAITVRTKLQKKDKYNIVKGIYRSPLNLDNPSDYPVMASDAYVAVDGEELPRELNTPYTTRPQTSRRIAKIELLKCRQEITARIVVNMKGLRVRTGNTIMLTIPKYGWNQKIFEVTNFSFQMVQGNGSTPSLAVALELRETAAAVFDWNTDEESLVDPAPNTTLPNYYDVDGVVGLRFDSAPVVTVGGDKLYLIRLTWDPHDDSFVTNNGLFEIQYKLSSASNYNPSFFVSGAVNTSELFQSSLQVEYDVRIRAVNHLGGRSAWNYLLNMIAGSSGGVTVTNNWGAFVGDAVGTSLDWGAFVGDPVGTTDDWGAFQ